MNGHLTKPLTVARWLEIVQANDDLHLAEQLQQRLHGSQHSQWRIDVDRQQIANLIQAVRLDQIWKENQP